MFDCEDVCSRGDRIMRRIPRWYVLVVCVGLVAVGCRCRWEGSPQRWEAQLIKVAKGIRMRSKHCWRKLVANKSS